MKQKTKREEFCFSFLTWLYAAFPETYAFAPTRKPVQGSRSNASGPSVPQLSACQEFTLFGRGFSWSDLFCWNVKGLVLEFFCWFTRCFVLWVDIFTSGIASRQTPHITGPHSLRCVSSCPAVLQCQCQSRLSPSLQRMTAEQSDHLLPVHNECQILKTDRIETLVFPMIIDFFKNVKTHSQIISLSPHCYSPPNLVPGSRFLWPGSKWPGPGLVTPRHSEKGPSGAEWQMVSSGEWAPGVSGLWLPKCICGKWLQLRSRDVCYVRDVAPQAGTGPGPTVFTLSQKFSLWFCQVMRNK